MAAEPSTPQVPDSTAARLVAERAYTELRDQIVTLHLPPGTVLREDQLMGDLGIGRTPLREAVKRLALENLVEVQPRRGTFVSPVEAADIANITEVRAELEGYAAELAALRLDPEGHATAETLLHEVEHLRRPDDQDWLMRFDERIHRFTWEATGNPYLIQTLERYFTHSLRIWYLVLDRLPHLFDRVHEHRHLLAAIRAGQPKRAHDIAADHVATFETEIRGVL